MLRTALVIVGALSCVPAVSAQTSSAQTPASSSPGIAASARDAAARTEPDRREASASRTDATGDKAAQEPTTNATRMMIGVGFKQAFAPGEDTANSNNLGFMWRWRGKTRRMDNRFALSYGLNSFNTQLLPDIGGSRLTVGDVKVRPIMIGVDYKMPRGRWTWSAGIQAGWAMNSVDAPPIVRNHVIRTTGANDLWVDVNNSLVWAPKFKAWYDYNERVSFQIDAAYFVARPELQLRANGVASQHRLNADALVVKVGILYGIF